MRDIAYLALALKENATERVLLEDEIARHPVAIAQVFDGFLAHDGCRSIVSQIERLEKCSGWTGGRKNQFEWFGYRYRIVDDPKEYWVRSGGNWCSGVDECGEYGDDGCDDIDMAALQQDITIDECAATNVGLDWICKLRTWQAVGYLLRLKMGV